MERTRGREAAPANRRKILAAHEEWQMSGQAGWYNPDHGESLDAEYERDADHRAQAEEAEMYAQMYDEYVESQRASERASERESHAHSYTGEYMGDDFDQRPYDERFSDPALMPGTDMTEADALARAHADGLAAKRALGIPTLDDMAAQARAIAADMFPAASQFRARLQANGRALSRPQTRPQDRAQDRAHRRSGREA